MKEENEWAGVRQPFGVTKGGERAELLTLENEKLSCQITTYGGALVSLRVPNRTGQSVDVVLGFDTLAEYEAQDKYMGALMGRCANRIANGRFSLAGKVYALAVNNGPNHLHGGLVGFDRRCWTVEEYVRDRVVLSLVSPDGEEGYPGTLRVVVTYALEGGTLSIHYRAETDQDTLCNLTNHSYFNLGGQGSGPVLDQEMKLYAQRFTPADANAIPTGEIASVSGTPMDFSDPTPIGAGIEARFQQLQWGMGYDHNYVIDGPGGVLRPAAEAYCPATGIALFMETTMPGLQFYTANYVHEGLQGKAGAVYGPRHAFCLESQFFPDAIHHPNFVAPILCPGGVYDHLTQFTFSVR